MAPAQPRLQPRLPACTAPISPASRRTSPSSNRLSFSHPPLVTGLRRARPEVASAQLSGPSQPTTMSTTPTTSTAAASAAVHLIVVATVYRQIARATGNSAP
jgi:hypothetical protein